MLPEFLAWCLPSIWKILPLTPKILHFSYMLSSASLWLQLYNSPFGCVLHMSIQSISFVLCALVRIFFTDLSYSSLIHFSDMYNLLLGLLPFSWLSFWQIFYLFPLLTNNKHESLQILNLSSQKQIKLKWVNFAIISNINKYRSWSIMT